MAAGLSMHRLQDVLSELQRLLQSHPGDDAAWIGERLHQLEEDPQAAYRELNSRRMWGGAGSVANQALADNPGMDDWSWRMHVREVRERMIELGELLQAEGRSYPDIGQWIMAFNQWNQSEI